MDCLCSCLNITNLPVIYKMKPLSILPDRLNLVIIKTNLMNKQKYHVEI